MSHIRRATTAIQHVATKELTTRRSTYDWRSVIGLAALASAYVLGRASDLPADWLPWIRKIDVALGAIGVFLAVQGRPLIPPPPPADAIDERGDS